ncbi:hypothetical protein NM208_g13393 [Fusarium decemcellulare]|uniref:Uncharacterized protein n=1 Tax=Fusarium decemcellulare TaxID=57161 RepID=A0ACC1RKQ9_9HYPO|nr:hypothetical protein NM208_g13393 [Fusarium decemcellulare]
MAVSATTRPAHTALEPLTFNKVLVRKRDVKATVYALCFIEPMVGNRSSGFQEFVRREFVFYALDAVVSSGLLSVGEGLCGGEEEKNVRNEFVEGVGGRCASGTAPQTTAIDPDDGKTKKNLTTSWVLTNYPADPTSPSSMMESLKRNQTTADQAIALEDGQANPLQPGTQHSKKYFEILKVRRSLPAAQKQARQRLLDLYHQNQVVVVSAAIGSGKTTQLTQHVMFDEWESKLMVACTQPRKTAALDVAKQVAEELDVSLGSVVGTSVRFLKQVTTETRLQFMTDGMLLRELQDDPFLLKYACVIIDEAHERTTNTDILLALLKYIISRRRDLKLVIMSATLEATKFAKYFGYLEHATDDYYLSSLVTVCHIHEKMPPGDILVFLTSIGEIERFCSKLRAVTKNLVLWPLYSALLPGEQKKALGRSPMRKCVVATNVAEASLTIDGIVYVVGMFLDNVLSLTTNS